MRSAGAPTRRLGQISWRCPSVFSRPGDAIGALDVLYRRLVMILRRAVVAALFLLALAPGRASADTLIVPFWGVNFGGDSGKTFSSAAESKQQTFGVSAAFFGGGVVATEADFGYSPDFFGKTDTGGSSVLTMTGNVVLAVPLGGQKGFGVRPYALAGVGVLKSS